jgi:DNA-binding transcriptional MerR regulator
MTNFTLYTNHTVSLVCLPAGASAFFPLDLAARLTGVHPEMLRYYQRVGLIEALPAERESELLFDEEALQKIRQIEHFRRHLGVGRRALPLLCELRREGNRREIELRFLDCS